MSARYWLSIALWLGGWYFIPPFWAGWRAGVGAVLLTAAFLLIQTEGALDARRRP